MLRKIMRRAMRNARLIGKQEPYLYELTGFVAQHMSPGYPELMESVQRVARVVKDEEHRYATTFLVAEKVFSDEISRIANGTVPGSVSFKLYDTYCLALDEQEDIASRARRRDRPRQASKPRCAFSGSGRAPVGRAARRALIVPAYPAVAPKKAARSFWAMMSWTPYRR